MNWKLKLNFIPKFIFGGENYVVVNKIKIIIATDTQLDQGKVLLLSYRTPKNGYNYLKLTAYEQSSGAIVMYDVTRTCFHKLSKYYFNLFKRKLVTIVRYLCSLGNFTVVFMNFTISCRTIYLCYFYSKALEKHISGNFAIVALSAVCDSVPLAIALQSIDWILRVGYGPVGQDSFTNCGFQQSG